MLTAFSTTDSSILIHDLHTCNQIQTFRQSAIPPAGLAIMPSKNLVLAAQAEKSVVHAYTWGKEGIAMKMNLPERMRSLNLSPTGNWCAGGSESGKLYLWEVKTLTVVTENRD